METPKNALLDLKSIEKSAVHNMMNSFASELTNSYNYEQETKIVDLTNKIDE
jgi:hypothetical protein